MCMVDFSDGGYNDFNFLTRRRARKEHKCGECGRVIGVGETYVYTAWKYDGEVASAKHCSHCDVACRWLDDNCGGYLTWGVREDIQEHVQAYRGDAACVPRLKRLDVGMYRRWKVTKGPRAGQLMPIPQLPAKLEPKHTHH